MLHMSPNLPETERLAQKHKFQENHHSCQNKYNTSVRSMNISISILTHCLRTNVHFSKTHFEWFNAYIRLNAAKVFKSE